MKYFGAYRFNRVCTGIWCLLLILLIVSCSRRFQLEKRRYTKGWYLSHTSSSKERSETIVTRRLEEKNNEIQSANNDQEQIVAARINQDKFSDWDFLKAKPQIGTPSQSIPSESFKKEKATKENSGKNVIPYRKNDAVKKFFKAVVLVLTFCSILFFVLFIFYMLLLIFGAQIGPIVGNAGVEVFLAVIALLAIGISLLLTMRVKDFME